MYNGHRDEPENQGCSYGTLDSDIQTSQILMGV
jgi:hypothetical protein